MAIAVELTTSATLEGYFKALTIMGMTPEGSHPDPGCLFHWVTEIPGGGYRIIDVWKTKEQFDKFAQDKLAPVVQQLGRPEPQIKFIDVANYLTAGS
jgi:hypothetical protein